LSQGGARLRVLLACDSLGIGGAERHIIALAAGLKRRGHDVTIACSVGGSLGGQVAASGVALRALSNRLVKRRVSVSYARTLARLVAAGDFDLVHAHMHASAAVAAVACARADVPLVITEHTEASWRDERARRTSRSAYHRAAHLIAVSGPIRRRLTEDDGVPAERVSLIRNAIPPIHGRRRNGTPLLHSLVSGDPLIGTVARLVPEKGVACLLLAAVSVLRALPKARFVIIGDGPLREELAANSRKLGIASRVSFLGGRVDAPQLIGDLDVLAIPSLSNEGTPLVTLEALSAGVAVVATAVGGIPEQVRGFHRVALVPPGDVAALARALVETATVARRSSSPRAGEILVLPGHEAMVRQTEAVYASVCAETRRRTATQLGAIGDRWLGH
jgi:glycosyltransferase involved in cell wall biosynthesis